MQVRIRAGVTVNHNGTIHEAGSLIDLEGEDLARLGEAGIVTPLLQDFHTVVPLPEDGQPPPDHPVAPAAALLKPRESAFDVDPALLAGVPLEQLNVMIAERDPEIGLCDTVEEAVSILSKDFVKH